MGQNILLFPPIAFLIFFLASALLYLSGSLLEAKGKPSAGKKKPYACGEDIPAQKMQPNYESFFPFALFFTIIHVTALILATLPAGNIALIGLLYMGGVAIALYTLVVR
jgi:NADH-quinone oxidoreductase subunit A